jgi:NADH-quinone oxidoreductase subunit E
MSVLTPELREKIRSYFPRYPSKQAVTLPALHLVQDELRCVPTEAVVEIAELLELHPAEVQDAMTFYGFFRGDDDRLGRTRLWVCRGLACVLREGEEVLADFCHKLSVKPGGCSSDGKITVEFAECIGMCEVAPAVLLDDAGRGPVTRDKVDEVIQELRSR